MLELAPVAFLVTDELGVVREANEAAGALFGVSRRHLTGKPLAVFAADQREFRRQLVRIAKDGWEVHRLQLALLRRDSGRFHATLSVRLLRPGEQPHLAWVIQDVEPLISAQMELRLLTEHLEARVEERTEELERQRAVMATLIREVPAGLLVADAASRRIVLANDQLAEILGDASVVGRDVDNPLFRAHDAAGVSLEADRWPFARALAGEDVVGLRATIDRPDGGEVDVDISVSPLRSDGRVTGAVAVLRDVTDETRRQRAEREFVANAAHELQTPIAAIMSAAEVLLSGAKDEPEARDHFLAHIHREAGRLTRLARALLALARAQSGVEGLRHELVGLRPLLDDVAASAPVVADVHIEIECPPELALITNRDLVTQVLANLVSNAVKFSRAGPVVLRAVPVGETRVVVEVTDRGPGIPEGEEERIFDRFYRAPRSEASGFGLGLAIVRDAVEALEGTIRVARTGREGTTFEVELPGAELVP